MRAIFQTTNLSEIQDSFISGWEEGGELNAIISIKVLDRSKLFQVKAHIEAKMTTPSIAGEVSVEADIQKSNLSKETETTITVNWSGGGSIKDPNEDWSIETLKKAAAAFPDLVAITPQRTYAILTRYTALDSFHRQKTDFKPLDYENAGIYTGALLDAYMDYKSMWKQISQATYELEGNRATIQMGEPSEEMARLAEVTVPVDDDASASATGQQLVPAESAQNQLIGRSKSELIPVFTPSFAGLIQARKVCRLEMSKIVREVNLVSKAPTLATDSSRDTAFLHPLVFKQLLPVGFCPFWNKKQSLKIHRLSGPSRLKTQLLVYMIRQQISYSDTASQRSKINHFLLCTIWPLISKSMISD